uniref:Uncharacterized protein n=1 Tax=Setaria viridis TaxID=4556 RepID=A0A4V6D9H9_SETVI|nr:hypothetical protein SEVIR_3G148350v2 [Setaria viridis]
MASIRHFDIQTRAAIWLATICNHNSATLDVPIVGITWYNGYYHQSIISADQSCNM